MVAFKRAPGSCAGGDCCDPCPDNTNTCLDGEGNPVEDDFTQITVTVAAGSNPAPRYLGYYLDGSTKYFFMLDFVELEGDYVINFDAEDCEWSVLEGSITLGSFAVTITKYIDDCLISTQGFATSRSLTYQMIFNPSTRQLSLTFDFIMSSNALDFANNPIFPFTLFDSIEFTAEISCSGGEMDFAIDNPHPNDDPAACFTYPPPDDMTADYVLS